MKTQTEGVAMKPSTPKTELQPSTRLRKVVSGGALSISLLAVLMIATTSEALAQEPAWWTQQKKDCGLSSSLAYNDWVAQGMPCNSSGGRNSGNPPPINYEAERIERERLAKEKAEAVAAAERERLAAEKRKKEKDAEFIRDRDSAASTLKGSSGTAASQLKGLSGTDNSGLKGSGFDMGSTGLKELRGDDRGARDQQGPQTAWKQLHCAAEIAGFALRALQKGEYGEFGVLSAEAMKALDGRRIDVVCNAAPPFPDLHGRAVDMDQVKEVEKKILSRATAISERMKQRGEQPTLSPDPAQTAKETPEEKIRRVQRELNQANSQKITGKTQNEIDQQERDRKELAKLIIANNGLAKGELTSVGVNDYLEEAVPPSKPRRK